MVTVAKVVTPERFVQGLTWEQYVDQITANKERFLSFYQEFRVKPEDVEFFTAFVGIKGGVKVVAIGEDWCPDVVRGIPVMVRIAEASGMELKIFPRDANLDLMNEYMWRHQFQAIPTFVFFDNDFNELGHWIERPAIAYKLMAELRDKLANLPEEERRAESRRLREEAEGHWMQETVRELRELLYRVM